jgi:hypothetical protein
MFKCEKEIEPMFNRAIVLSAEWQDTITGQGCQSGDCPFNPTSCAIALKLMDPTISLYRAG